MRRVAAAIAAGACLAAAIACGSFSGDATPAEGDGGGEASASADAAPDVATDAPPADAGATGCAKRSPAPFFCADFDDGLVMYGSGVAFSLPSAGAGVSVAARGPGTSAPNALWIDDDGGSYQIPFTGAGGTKTTRMHATFQIMFDRIDSTVTDTGFLRLGIQVSYGTCYVDLQPVAGYVRMQSHCGKPDQNRYNPPVLSSLPARGPFLPVTFDVDFAQGQAVTTIASFPAVTMDLGATETAGGVPTILVQVGSAGRPAFALDDVVVTVE